MMCFGKVLPEVAKQGQSRQREGQFASRHGRAAAGHRNTPDSMPHVARTLEGEV